MNGLGDQVIFYRLKQTDFDGLFEYFNVVSVEANPSDNPSFTVYPNPTDGVIKLNFSNLLPNETVKVEIKDILGKTIYSNTINTEKGGNITVVMNLGNILTAGTYFIMVGSVSTFNSNVLIIK